MKKTLFTAICIAGSLLASCSSIQTLTFDQLYPAEITYPEQVTRVAVVNNMAPIPEPKDGLVTIGLLEGDGKIAAETLAGALADSRYFNQVLICDSVLRSDDARPTDPSMLTPAQVDTLASQLGVDMLFSVERILMKTSRQEMLYPGFSMPLSVIEMKTTPLVRVYLPTRSTPVTTLTKPDSLYWEVSSGISDKMMVEEGSSRALTSLINDLVPYWGQTSRLYYDGGCVEMRDAAVCLRENDWAGARELWTRLYESRKKGKVKMRAAFNVALAWEMEGDVAQAAEWLKKAEACETTDANDREVLAYYTYQLNEKMKDLPRLDLQMKRFVNKIP